MVRLLGMGGKYVHAVNDDCNLRALTLMMAIATKRHFAMRARTLQTVAQTLAYRHLAPSVAQTTLEQIATSTVLLQHAMHVAHVLLRDCANAKLDFLEIDVKYKMRASPSLKNARRRTRQLYVRQQTMFGAATSVSRLHYRLQHGVQSEDGHHRELPHLPRSFQHYGPSVKLDCRRRWSAPGNG